MVLKIIVVLSERFVMVVMQEWFTVEEAAEYLRVSKRTIYKLTEEGRLPAFRIGK